MPREVILTLYQYHELDDKAKEKAKQWWLGCWDENDNNQITEIFEYELGEAGYPVEDIGWSLNYSQGDGMAFYTGKDDANLKRIWLRRISRGWPRADRKELYRLVKTYELDLKLEITRNCFGHRYSHYNTMSVSLYEYSQSYEGLPADDVKTIVEFTERLEKDIAADVRSLSQALTLKGYAAMQEMQSEEAVASAMEANEYTFTKDGTRHG